MLKPQYLFIAIVVCLLITIAEAAEQSLAAATVVLYNKAARGKDWAWLVAQP